MMTMTNFFRIQKYPNPSTTAKKTDPSLIYKLNTLIHTEGSDIEEGRKLIREIQGQSTRESLTKESLDVPNSTDGMTPVMYAFRQGRYDFSIELMNEGASLGIVTSNGWSIISACIREERLPQIKLLVWFDPQLLTKLQANAFTNNKTPSDNIKIWDSRLQKERSNTNKKFPGQIIDESIQDSSEVQQLLSQVNLLIKQKADVFKIAELYSQIATIYYRQLKIEKEFDRSKYALNPRTMFFDDLARQDSQFYNIALKFYGSMAFKYFLEAENIYNNTTQGYSPEYRRKHFICLHRLTKINDFFGATSFPYRLSKEQQEFYMNLEQEQLSISSLTKPTTSQSSHGSSIVSMEDGDSPDNNQETNRLLGNSSDSSHFLPSYSQQQQSFHTQSFPSSDIGCRQRSKQLPQK